MKKYLCIFAAAILLFACAETDVPKEQFSLPIVLTAQLEGSNSPFTAYITEGECDIIFDENHSLSGTELHFDEQGGIATVGGFTRTVEIDIFPAQKALINAIRALNGKNISGESKENGTKYTIDEMTIMVYYDKDTEEIIGIGTEESGQRFNFTVSALDHYEIQSDSTG